MYKNVTICGFFHASAVGNEMGKTAGYNVGFRRKKK